MPGCCFPRIVAILLLLTALASGQDPRGTILGRVEDSTGAVIAGIEVRAVNRATGVAASARTNTAGSFNLPFLLAGVYTVTAEMPGFKRFVRDNVEVRVAESVELRLVMEIGAVSETVEVTAESPLLTTTDASQGTVVDERAVMELPLLGGNPVELALLDPAIMNETDLRERRASMTNASSQWSAMGGGSFRNEFQIDGVSNTFAEGNARARVAFNPPTSAIGQFKIMTNPFDAAAGNTLGAVLNVATKGGTNKYRGEAHWYARNRAFDCNDFFNNRNGTQRPVYQDNRFGFSYGGPVRIPRLYHGRNKTFFFYTWEANPYTVPQTSTQTVPTAAERQGDFSALLDLPNGARYQIYNPYTTRRSETNPNRFVRDPFPGNILPKSLFNPAGYALANLYPLPSRPGNIDGIDNYYNGSSAVKNREDYYVHLARIDHAFSESHRFFVRVHYDFWEEHKLRRFDTDPLIQGIVLKRINRGAALDDVILLGPNLVLNVRYGITQQEFPEYRESRGTDLAALGFSRELTRLIDPARATIPRVAPSDYSAYSTWEKGDGTNTSLTHNANATMSTQRGSHSLRWGADFRVYRAFENRFALETSPQFNFAQTYTRGPNDNSAASPKGQDLASMLLGIPTGGSMERPATFALQNLYFGAFLQDDLKLTRALTVNLGLRYEIESPLTERFDRLVAGYAFDTPNPIDAQARANYARSPIPEIDPAQFRAMGGILFAGETAAGRSPFRTEKNNLLPRIGLAWAVNSKTTVRTGYGIYFGTIGVNGTDPQQYGFSQSTPIQSSLDSGQTYEASVSNPFPGGLLEAPGRSGGLRTYLSQAIVYHNLNRKQPYSQRWTFGVQRTLPWDFMAEASYVGNRGTRLGVNRQVNPLPRQYLSTAPLRDQAVINYLGEVFNNPFFGLGPFYTRTITRANLLRPYPHFGNITTEEPVGYNWYHSLQIRAARRLRSFTSTFGYAFSKLMDATSFLNETDPLPYEVISGSHRPHRLTASGVWEVPVGRGRRYLRRMPAAGQLVLGGWQFSAIVMRQAGPPLAFGNIPFAGDIKDIPLPKSQRNVDRWFNTEAGFFTSTAFNLASNIRAFPPYFASVQADGQAKWDLSLTKSFRLREIGRASCRERV